MNCLPKSPPRPRRRFAFSMVEVLVVLAILCVLMAALGGAFYGSIQTYDENDKMASVTQTARCILDRMVRDVRNCNDIDPNSTSTHLVIQPTLGGPVRQIEYELANGILYYRQTSSAGVVTSQDLLDGNDPVQPTSLTITRVSGQDWQGTTCTVQVRAQLTVSVSNQSLSVTASSSPRKNQLY